MPCGEEGRGSLEKLMEAHGCRRGIGLPEERPRSGKQREGMQVRRKKDLERREM